MQQMRENTKWIMLLTALAFVALMVFEWGMDLSGGSAAQFTGGEIGSVNDEPITYEQFNLAYRELYEQRQAEGSPITTAENRQLEEQAWEQVVMDKLIAQELRRRDLRVTNAEIREAARYAPPPEFYQYELFQTDGRFDLAKYHQFLTTQGDVQLLQQLEGYYRQILPRSKLFQQVGAGVVIPDGELWRLYRERNEQATVRYAALDPQRLIADAQATVSDAEIAEYHEENVSQFERPARAEAKIVSIDRTPVAADTAAALARAQELRQRLEDGADYAQVASEESADDVSASQGGDLGTIRKGQTVPRFEEAVWSARLDRITQPVQTEFGFHLIRVDSRTEEEAEVAHILIPIERTVESEDRMLGQVDSLEGLIERMTLTAAAGELGLVARTTELNPLLPNLPGIGSVGEGVDWVFEDEPAPGEVSPVFENEESYYVLELVEREAARNLTLAEATPTIRRILAAQRKREQTRDIGRALVDRIEAGMAFDSAVAGTGATIRAAGPFSRLDFVPGLGAANAAIGAAFGLPVGEVSGLIETPDAFYILEVTDRMAADSAAWGEQKESQRRQIVGAIQSQRVNQFLEALRDEADIRDDRARVLQPVATTPQ